MSFQKILFSLCCSVVFFGGVISSYLLFNISEKEEPLDKLIPLEIVEKNKLNAPKINLSFPAHQTDSFRSCLSCHGVSDKIVSKRENTLNPQFISMGFNPIPVIPHEHNENLNCLSCHGK